MVIGVRMFDYVQSVVKLYQKLSPDSDQVYLIMGDSCPNFLGWGFVERDIIDYAEQINISIDRLIGVRSDSQTWGGLPSGHVIILSKTEPSLEIMSVAMSIAMLKKNRCFSVQTDNGHVKVIH